MKTTVKANIEKLSDIISVCEQAVPPELRSTKDYNMLLVAIEEIFVNISSYSYPDKDGEVLFEIENTGDNTVKVQFLDSGKAFDPLEYDSGKKAKNNIHNLIPGGLGIELVKRITENLSYRYENKRNILCFEKTLEVMP